MCSFLMLQQTNLNRNNEITFESNVYFEKALEILAEFKISPDTEKLKKASDYLLESIKYDKRHAPTYYYLSYVFYSLDNSRFAAKFVSMAEKLCPEPPIELLQFKNKVFNEGAMYKSFEFAQQKSISFEMPNRSQVKVNKPAELKAVVNTDSNFYKLNEMTNQAPREPVKSSVQPVQRISASRQFNVDSEKFQNVAEKINQTKPEPIKVKLSEKSSFWNILKK